MNDLIPFPIQKALKQIGKDISVARRARGWSQEEFAKRLDVSLSTARRLENGFDGTALQTFLRALHVLGLLDNLVNIMAVKNNDLSLYLMQEQLPKHIHSNNQLPTPSKNTSIVKNQDDELEGF